VGRPGRRSAGGYRPKRGRPPEGWLSEDAAHRRLRDFLDEHTRSTPPERITFERCADAFITHCEENGRSANTLRTYRQIVRELKARWPDWRVVDVDYDELEDYHAELVEAGLAASTRNQRRAVLSGAFRRARREFRVAVDPMDGFERSRSKTPATSRSTAWRRCGRSCAQPVPAFTTAANAPTRTH
jgi:Phage integrase, N-terminal SAM-like domain